MSESTPGFPTPFFSTVCGGKGQGKGTKPKTNVNLLYIIFGYYTKIDKKEMSICNDLACFLLSATTPTTTTAAPTTRAPATVQPDNCTTSKLITA